MSAHDEDDDGRSFTICLVLFIYPREQPYAMSDRIGPDNLLDILVCICIYLFPQLSLLIYMYVQYIYVVSFQGNFGMNVI